jgi:TPP-dependent pyruvate/acetoin dehydrogenase alpha subunit
MAVIRRFEEVTQALFQRGAIMGSIHLGMGQEAVATGVCSTLAPSDQVAATYRGHAAALALGSDPSRLFAEMLGRRTGVCGGRAGSMNIVDREHGLLGCFGIVGGSIGAATGAGLSLKRHGGVAVAFFGDGAVNQGYFHECLNFAAVHALPVLYVCENNRYAEFTASEDATAGQILARPQAMGIPSETVDGQDVWAVREAAQRAISLTRTGSGPAFIEALTYRYNDHSRGDPIQYRPTGELERWRARDPLVIAAAQLATDHDVPQEALESILAEVGSAMDVMRDAAFAAPTPDASAQMSEFKTSQQP